jgi:peptidoglycan/xylan/chitin deacetylase (PgdA/CDA1 family)
MLDPVCMEYPKRHYGMDHDRYAWSMLTDRKAVKWPNGKLLALWVNVSLQHFPMNPQGKPVKLPGSMTMPYPDLRHFTLRDYGNRVGIWRLLKAFDQYEIQPTFAVNAVLAERYPYLIAALRERGNEILAHSWSMDTVHAGGVDPALEAETIKRSIATLRASFDHPIRGWLSPGKLESPMTPELIRAEGIEYFCDWVNDELPYSFHTANGDLWAMPLATEIEDRLVVMDNQHSESSWAQQVIDAARFLLDESRTQGGRILSLSIHPWVMGQPHRVKHVEAVLEFLGAQEGIWSASAGEILDAFVAQQ